METKSRRKFSLAFKAKVVLEALKERSTMEELARKYELHPTQIAQWKKEAVNNLSVAFGKTQKDFGEREGELERLYSQIGRLKVENKKNLR